MLEFDYLDDFDFYLAALTLVLALFLPRRYLPVEKPETARRIQRMSWIWRSPRGRGSPRTTNLSGWSQASRAQ